MIFAVQNQLGGSDSESKREWLAGAICDMFNGQRGPDLEDVETTLLLAVLDEFELNVDDGTGFEVAQTIMRIRKQTLEGDFREIQEMQRKWEEKKKNVERIQFQVVANGDDEETDWDTDDMEDDEEDIEMAEAPPEKPKQGKAEAQIDEDGFTKVIGKKKR